MARQVPITIIDEPEHTHAQARWVERMAFMARDHLGADWIVNSDADEFWLPEAGDLKRQLTTTDACILTCRRYNMVCAHDDAEEIGPWHRRIVHHIARPVTMTRAEGTDDGRWGSVTWGTWLRSWFRQIRHGRAAKPFPFDFPPAAGLDRITSRFAPPLECRAGRDLLRDPLPCPYFFLDLPPKLIVRARGLVSVGQGNHSAGFAGPTPRRPANTAIYHFPVRSRGRFLRKILQSARAQARNPDLPETSGWHWRRWRDRLEAGFDREVLAEALPSRAMLNYGDRTGGLVRDETVKRILDDHGKAYESVSA